MLRLPHYTYWAVPYGFVGPNHASTLRSSAEDRKRLILRARPACSQDAATIALGSGGLGRQTEGGLDSAPDGFVLAVDALGVHLEQDVDAVAGPLGHLGGRGV